MPRAFSMHEYQRVVATEGRISGSWHVNLGTRADSDVWIKPHDVTIYDEERRSGRVLFGDDLTACIRKGEARISYTSSDKQFEVDEVRDELLRLLPAIAEAARDGSVVEVPQSPGQEHDMTDSVQDRVMRALAHRAANGWQHRHHQHCIHNLPPEEQVALRRRTPEEYVALHGAMPVQITPDDWECESPFAPESHGQEQ